MKIPWRKPKALVATPEFVDSLVNRSANVLVPLGGGSSQLINAKFLRGQSCSYGWLYSHRPAVRIVIDYIASQVSALPLKLYERMDDADRQQNRDHPAALTMDRPDGGRTPSTRFIKAIMSDWLVYDRVIILKIRQDGVGPLSLVRWPSPLALVAGDKHAQMYRLIRTDGSWFEVPPEDIIDWHGYNPDDALMGVSKLETLRDSLTEDQVSQAAIVELMRAGLKGGHIERPLEAPEWSETAMMRFLESWVNQRRQAGKDPLLEDGMTWVQDAITPKDAELLAGRRFTVEEVAMTYGVPPEVLGLAGGDGSQDLKEAEDQVNVDLLPPLIEDLAGSLNQDILDAEYFATDFFFEFDLNARLRGDPVARFAAITSATGRPWQTVNEARRLENLPPIDGGDELTIPLNVALGELPAPNVMPPQDPNGPPADGTNPTAPTQQDAKPKAIGWAEHLTVAAGEYRAVDATASLPVVNQAALKAANDEVTEILHRLYRRQAAAVRKRKFKHDRFERELVTDLMTFASIPRAEVEAVAHDFVDVVWQSVQGQAPAKVFAVAHERAPKMAEFLISTLAPDGRVGERAAESDVHPALANTDKLEKLRLLRETLNVPDEFLWSLAGFTEEEIDQMRAMQNTAALLAATNAG